MLAFRVWRPAFYRLLHETASMHAGRGFADAKSWWAGHAWLNACILEFTGCLVAASACGTILCTVMCVSRHSSVGVHSQSCGLDYL